MFFCMCVMDIWLNSKDNVFIFLDTTFSSVFNIFKFHFFLYPEKQDIWVFSSKSFIGLGLILIHWKNYEVFEIKT